MPIEVVTPFSRPRTPTHGSRHDRHSASVASQGDRPNEGHGRRLTAAFEALEFFPALAESRNRVLRLVREERSAVGDVVRPSSPTSRWSPPSCGWPTASPPREGQDRQRSRGREAAHARGRRAAGQPRQGLRLLRAHPRLGRRSPSVSASTRWPPRPPPTGWPASLTTRSATSCSPRRCCTTSASWCSCTRIPPTRRRSTARRARPRIGSTASAASSAWTTPWSAACWPAAGACPMPWPPRSSATTPTTPTGRPPWFAWRTCWPTTATARPLTPTALRAARALEMTPSSFAS